MRRGVPVALVALLPSTALAATKADHGHGGIPWATLIFSAVNLLIFVLILHRAAWPAVRNWVQNRRRQIVDTLEEAARAKRDAEQLKAEWERRLASLSAELDAMRQQARADIARERDQILAAAQRACEAIGRDAQRVAEQEVRRAQALLREEVARRALQVARELAAQQLTPADQQRFVADFLEQVES